MDRLPDYGTRMGSEGEGLPPSTDDRSREKHSSDSTAGKGANVGYEVITGSDTEGVGTTVVNVETEVPPPDEQHSRLSSAFSGLARFAGESLRKVTDGIKDGTAKIVKTTSNAILELKTKVAEKRLLREVKQEIKETKAELEKAKLTHVAVSQIRGEQGKNLRDQTSGKVRELEQKLAYMEGKKEELKLSSSFKQEFKARLSKSIDNSAPRITNVRTVFSEFKTSFSEMVSANNEGSGQVMSLEDEAKWRAHDKYDTVQTGIKEGLDKVIDQMENNGDIHVLLSQLRDGAEFPPGAKGTEEELNHHLKEMVDCLDGTKTFATERERHLALKTAQRNALSCAFYEQAPYDTPQAKLLNCLCAAEYTQVNAQTLTKDFAKDKAQTVESPSGGETHEVEFFETQMQREHLDSVHTAVGNQESLYMKVKGEVMFLNLDPVMQGNPVNVKASITTKEGREITDVRTPTPTDGKGEIIPEFKAYLRFLKATGQQHAYVNLQNRKDGPFAKKMLDCNGEHVRSSNLERLAESDEFKGVFHCFTLDKNSHFFHQSPHAEEIQGAILAFPEKATELNWAERAKDKHNWNDIAQEICEHARLAGVGTSMLEPKEQFVQSFMEELLSENSGFYLPEEYRNPPKSEEVRGILDHLASTVYADKHLLSPRERQNFLELAYSDLTSYFVESTGAEYFNQSCKDCIDRGGGANWLMLAKLVLSECHRVSMDPNATAGEKEKVREKVQALPYKLQEDALWARKRGLIYERLDRAEGAINTLVRLSKENPEAYNAYMERYEFAQAEFHT